MAVAAKVVRLLDPALQREMRERADRLAPSVSWDAEGAKLSSLYSGLRQS
jgi:hypothetical protein